MAPDGPVGRLDLVHRTGFQFHCIARADGWPGRLLCYRPRRHDGVRHLGSLRVARVRERSAACKENPAVYVSVLRGRTRNDCGRAAIPLIPGAGGSPETNRRSWQYQY